MRLKITQQQYNNILLNEKRARLEALNSMINENTSPNTKLINEGWKEVVLGIALILGVGLTGQNKEIADEAIKNPETMAKIKSTLEDENSLEELIDALKEKGMKNPENKLTANIEKFIDDYNTMAINKIGVKAALALNNLNK